MSQVIVVQNFQQLQDTKASKEPGLNLTMLKPFTHWLRLLDPGTRLIGGAQGSRSDLGILAKQDDCFRSDSEEAKTPCILLGR